MAGNICIKSSTAGGTWPVHPHSRFRLRGCYVLHTLVRATILIIAKSTDMAEVWERLAAVRRRGIVENEPNSI
jgi:hypothetical protein